MIHMDAVAVSSRVSSADNASCKATDHQRPARCAWFDRLNGYLNAPTEPGGDANALSPGSASKGRIDWSEIFAILGGKNPRMGIAPYRFQRAADNGGAAAPVSREPVVGAPLKPDFGLELISVFRRSELNTWQRADAIAQVLQEWADEGPSQQAGKRLQRLFEPAYIHTPDEPAGGIVVDAILLHLMDRGRYMDLVRDHIDSLKRSGDYEPLVSALHRLYPDQDAAWARDKVDRLLGQWAPSLANAPASGDRGSIPPGIDLDTRLRKFHQLMNPDYRPGRDDRPIIRRGDGTEENAARVARADGAIKYA